MVTDIGKGSQLTIISRFHGLVVYQRDVPAGGIVGIQAVQCENLTCISESSSAQPVLFPGNSATWQWQITAGTPGPAEIILRADTYDQGSQQTLKEEIIPITGLVVPTPAFNQQRSHQRIANLAKSGINLIITVSSTGAAIITAVTGWLAIKRRKKKHGNQRRTSTLRKLHSLWTKTFQSTLALFAITTIVAVVAAFIKMVIGLASGNGWAWVSFFQDLTENFFIVAVIVYITAVLTDYQNRARTRREQSTYVLRRVETIAQVIGLPSGIGNQKDLLENPQDSDIIYMLTKKADAWSDLGSNFKELADERAKLDSEIGQSAFLQDLANKQAILIRMMWRDVSSRVRVLYAADGERKQRATYLSLLVDDLAIIAAANEGNVAAEAERCRELAIGLVARTQYTDALVESCLAFDLLAPPGSAARTVFAPYQADLAPFTRITDPVKGLIAYCDKALDIIESEPNYRSLLSSLFSCVAGALQALDLELTYASLLGRALARLLETTVPAGGGQQQLPARGA